MARQTRGQTVTIPLSVEEKSRVKRVASAMAQREGRSVPEYVAAQRLLLAELNRREQQLGIADCDEVAA